MVLKSDIEKDVRTLMESLRGNYPIPSSKEIILPVIKVMLVVYVMHVVAIISSLIIYEKNLVAWGDYMADVIVWNIDCYGVDNDIWKSRHADVYPKRSSG